MINNFLVSGMFRSGTTIFARMLHSNPYITCSSDPFAPIYKSYRNTVAEGIFSEFDILSPLNDYYFDENQNKLFNEIQNKDFSIAISEKEIFNLQKKIANHCVPYSPKIIPYLDMLKGKTYEDIFNNAINIVKKAYGSDNEKAVGFKEVWVGEFAPHFLKMSDQNKVIHVIRDPRSVVASNFASGKAYPLLFLIRQWRKLASLAWLNAQHNNAILIRFEDLISNTKEVANKVCTFLDVDFHENMIDPSYYKDGDGKQWTQNTSHEIKGSGKRFNKETSNKWKKSLDVNTTNLIETLCCFEMNLFNYNFTKKQDLKKSGELLDYKDTTQFSDWIKPYAKYDNFREISIELERIYLLKYRGNVSNKTLRLLLLNPEIVNHIFHFNNN
jgi:hypothetical protein